jgi:phage protein D
MSFKCYAAALLLMVPGFAGAQINKCLDASGKVVAYGSECPAGTRAETTNIKNQPGATQAPAQKSQADRDADFRKRQVERQEAAADAQKKGAETAERKRACDDARSYLQTLERGRVTRTDTKTGERVFLSDGEISAETRRAQQSVAQNCK